MNFDLVFTTLTAKSEAILNTLFGDSTLLVWLLEWNSAILGFCGLFITYLTVIGTMHTADKGESLGDKWHSMWVPLRTAVAIGLALPVIGLQSSTMDNLNGVQAATITIVKNGVGLADGAVRKVAASMGSPSLVADSGSSKEFATSMLASLICGHAAIANQGSATKGRYPMNGMAITQNTITTSVNSLEDVQTTYLHIEMGKDGICGVGDIAVKANKTPHYSALSLIATGDDDKTKISNAAGEAAIEAIQVLKQDLEPLAIKIVNGAYRTGPKINHSDYASFYQALYKFDNTRDIAAKAQLEQITGSNAYSQAVADQGYFGFGFYYYKLYEVKKEALGNALQPLPALKINWELAVRYAVHKDQVTKALSALNRVRAEYENNNAVALIHNGQTVNDLKWYSVESIGAYLMGFKTTLTGDGDFVKDPTDAVASLGNRAAFVAEALIIAGAGSDVLEGMGKANIAGSVMTKTLSLFGAAATGGLTTFAQGVAHAISENMPLLVLPIVIIAILFGVVIPFIPAAIWIVDLASVMMSWLVALAGSTFMLLGLMNPDSKHEVMGGGKFIFFIELLLRPLTSVGGFIMAMLVWVIVGGFSIELMFDMMHGMNDGQYHPIIILGSLIVIGAMLSILTFTCFSLAHSLHDDIFAFIEENTGSNGAEQSRTTAIGGVKSTTQQTSNLAQGGNKNPTKPEGDKGGNSNTTKSAQDMGEVKVQ